MSLRQRYDFAIVGSGFGGSVAALRLAEKGYSVAVIEKGRRWRPEDFPRTNWNLRKFFWMPALKLTGIQQLTLLRDVLVLHGSGVGGGSLVYANTLIKPDSKAFKDPRWESLGDWEKLLEPHYRRASEMLGSTVNPKLAPADEILREVAKDMKREDTFEPTTVGIYFGEPDREVPDPYFGGQGPPRSGCTFCGGCMSGCRVGAKNTLDRNYLYLAEKLGAEIIPETRVSQIKTLDNGGYRLSVERSTSLLFRRRSHIDCDQVILAAGVLGTLKLLLNSKGRGSLPLLSSMLGKRARSNSEALLGAMSRKRDDMWEGIAIGSNFFPDENTRLEPVRYTKGSDVMCLLGTPLTDEGTRFTRPFKWIATCIRHPMNLFRHLIPFRRSCSTVILLFMQTLDNSMDVALGRKWFFPFRKSLKSKPPVDGDVVPPCISLANETARQVALKIDGIPQSSLNEVLLNIPTTAHILGGCVMGQTPESGVVDYKCRVFGYPGMYIVDGSVIGANLGVNPSLTITAISEWAMSHISDKMDREQY